MADRSKKLAPAANDLDDSLWDSPVKSDQRPSTDQSAGNGKQNTSRPSHENDTARDAALRQELAGVRKVNETIEGLVQNLERAKNNMTTVNNTVGAASTLLNTWTRILSQTEHNQRLILDPAWNGASQDMADMETESQAKQHATQRRDAEEQERKAAAARKAEEAEQRRLVESTKPPSTSTRGRGRGISRGATARTPSSGYGTADTSTNSASRGTNSSRRPASGIGRAGRATSRGRG